jgi:plastocyanin domain-containing protein
MKKIVSIISTIVLLVIAGIIVGGLPRNNSASAPSTQTARNVEIKEGVQYITINARGGYDPVYSLAKAHIPTKLVVRSYDTYDCSSALIIRSIRYQKILPSSGEEIIDLGSPLPGDVQGTCSMGMYHFVISFKE